MLTDPTKKEDIKESKREEVARLVETLALGSVGKSTQKNYFVKLEFLGEGEKSAG